MFFQETNMSETVRLMQSYLEHLPKKSDGPWTSLCRTRSNYGLCSEIYNPDWCHARDILTSYLKRLDCTVQHWKWFSNELGKRERCNPGLVECVDFLASQRVLSFSVRLGLTDLLYGESCDPYELPEHVSSSFTGFFASSGMQDTFFCPWIQKDHILQNAKVLNRKQIPPFG